MICLPTYYKLTFFWFVNNLLLFQSYPGSRLPLNTFEELLKDRITLCFPDYESHSDLLNKLSTIPHVVQVNFNYLKYMLTFFVTETL